MKAFKVISGILSLLITQPIWFYLLHSILVAVNADRLLMFLFWVYVPVSFLAAGISIAIDKAFESKEFGASRAGR